MIRKTLGWLGPALLIALIFTQWKDITRYLKIKQMSLGSGHPENVPATGPTSYQQQEAGQPQAAQGAGRIAGH